MKRSPLCGRSFEYFSEDPYLSGKMAAAYVRGIQENGIAACPKHFAVNSQELRRMASNSVLDERTLRELYLTAFEIVVKEASPKTIMSAYNKVNDTYANESKHLLVDILRKEWGFDGAVVTDWGGSNDHVEGVKNGSTLEMPSPGLGGARKLLKAVADGSLTEQEIDLRVDELLEVVFSTTAAIEKAPHKFDEKSHHELARRAAAQSIVLLKNEGNLLPLKYGIKVALIGDFAIAPRYQGAGSSMVNPTQVDSLKEAMERAGLNMVGYCAGYERSGRPNKAYLDEAVSQAKNGRGGHFVHRAGRIQRERGAGPHPYRHPGGAKAAAGCRDLRQPQRGGSGERRQRHRDRLDGAVQGCGARLSGRTGRRSRYAGCAHRLAEPLRQAGGDHSPAV